MILNLNIYKKAKNGGLEIAKTLNADTDDLLYGTIEDLIGTLTSLQEVSNGEDETSLIKNGLSSLKPILKDVFEVTDEDLRNTKPKELIKVFFDLFKGAFGTLNNNDNNNNNTEGDPKN